FRWAFHQIDGRPDGIVHIHHGKFGALVQKAFVLPFLERFVVDFHRIVRGAPPWHGLPTDESGVTHAPHIHAIFFEIVLAPALSRLFADPIHGAGLHNGVLWGVLLWGIRPKYGNARRPKNFGDLAFLGQVEHIE